MPNEEDGAWPEELKFQEAEPEVPEQSREPAAGVGQRSTGFSWT